LGDILALHSQVARAVAEQVRLELTPDEHAALTESRSVDPRAYDAYLKGRYFLEKGSPASSKRAIEYFESAIREDPNFAPAYAGLADTFT
jgi:hypothetical protein